MTQTETYTRRPRTPRTPFLLWEVVRDGDELVATGSREQADWDIATLTAEARADGDNETVYRAQLADRETCPAARACKPCPASAHAMH